MRPLIVPVVHAAKSLPDAVAPEVSAAVCAAAGADCVQPLGSTWRAWYVPGATPANVYAPDAFVSTDVSLASLTPSSSVSRKTVRPLSALSPAPSASVSSRTVPAIEPVVYEPKSLPAGEPAVVTTVGEPPAGNERVQPPGTTCLTT